MQACACGLTHPGRQPDLERASSKRSHSMQHRMVQHGWRRCCISALILLVETLPNMQHAQPMQWSAACLHMFSTSCSCGTSISS
eukprot:359374-Chlamydomonas_euryale.AAC.5